MGEAAATTGAMMSAPGLAGRHFGVLGLARSGLSTIGFLARSGAAVTGWDESPTAREAAGLLFPDLRIEDLMMADLAGLSGLVVSPGVPLQRHPLVRRARDAGIPVLGDMALFQEARATLPAHRVVGITGTNGKSTVTALVHHLLLAAGVPAAMGGNIGLPILDQSPLPAGGVHVLELSSYQLDLADGLAVDVAIWTNLTPDHLDRHGDMEGYYAAKAGLLTRQKPGAVAVIATDDAWTERAARDAVAPGVRLVTVSAGDVSAEDQAGWPALQGRHNAQNAAVAVMAARALGVCDATIAAGLASFDGLPHRMARVGVAGGVLYVNDSKATNPDSSAPALSAFPRIHWILGGRAKGDDLDACRPYLSHVVRAYVIGEAAETFARLLEPTLPVVRAGTIREAVQAAAAAASAGETVLLSPAAASFDQFRDFEERGRAFEAAVRELDGVRPAAGAAADHAERNRGAA